MGRETRQDVFTAEAGRVLGTHGRIEVWPPVWGGSQRACGRVGYVWWAVPRSYGALVEGAAERAAEVGVRTQTLKLRFL